MREGVCIKTCSRETYFTVNKSAEHSFSYFPSKENKYFKHIAGDELKVPEWK